MVRRIPYPEIPTLSCGDVVLVNTYRNFFVKTIRWQFTWVRGTQPAVLETSIQQRPVLCAASRILVLDASLPRALQAVSTSPPTSLTQRRCPCPRFRFLSCHRLRPLRRENGPKPKSPRYYSIPIGDPKNHIMHNRNPARDCIAGQARCNPRDSLVGVDRAIQAVTGPRRCRYTS
jgi:hypothetical protein